MKMLKRIILVIVSVLVLLVLGLIINNRYFYIKYQNKDTTSNTLSDYVLEQVHEIYAYLEEYGNDIFDGFGSSEPDLLIYNEAYEFLFCDQEPKGNNWTYIQEDETLNQFIYRREAVNSQAFAVEIDNKWVGSFATMDTYHKQIIQQLPFFFPPQFLTVDRIYYHAIVLHEMLHAYQGLQNDVRIDSDQHIHNVCSSYYDDAHFNELLEKEAQYLEKAIKTDDDTEFHEYILAFLNTRDERRQDCDMTAQEKKDECELEWLEGLARYMEYCSSRESKAMIMDGLDHIYEKAKEKNDDRYYALGMAQYMIILKLDVADEINVFTDNRTMEEIIRDLML